jgi:uncharacterized XkdX family phage protein
MNWFTLVKHYYENGRYSKENVAIFVQTSKINIFQYKEITGESFKE